jgi:hypothetical protein
MKDYFSMRVYVLTMLLRAFLSVIICLTAATGLGISATNQIKNNYFEFFYFLIVLMIEITMSGIYLWLFKLQRGQRNLESVNKRDCQSSCIAIFLRLGWHVALSLFIVIRIHMEGMMLKDYKWREVRDLTLSIMTFTVIHIVGFVVALIYQPLEYIRSDSDMGGAQSSKDKFSDIRNAPRQNEIVIEENEEDEE